MGTISDPSDLSALCFAGDTLYHGLGDTIVNRDAAYLAYEGAANGGSPYAMCKIASMIVKEERSAGDGKR